ncbi:MAG: hypothetical protein MHMPM18_000686 [Marteilia pararefringens]
MASTLNLTYFWTNNEQLSTQLGPLPTFRLPHHPGCWPNKTLGAPAVNNKLLGLEIAHSELLWL